MSGRIRRRRQTAKEPTPLPPVTPATTPYTQMYSGYSYQRPPPPKPKPFTRKEKQRRVLADEVASLRREVNRLKDAQRDGEKMDDEVWIRDGRIWFSHRCNGVLLEQEISKGWRITSSGTITPSFSCPACRAHFHATVIVQVERAGWTKPADWVPYHGTQQTWQTPQVSTPASYQPTQGYGWSF